MTASQLKSGYTTGTCAAAAVKVATMALCQYEVRKSVDIELPDGEIVSLPILYVKFEGQIAEAAVIKDAGDDPDITDKAIIKATVTWGDNDDIIFIAGNGVGIITKPGLQIPPGEPAINPAPREMIKKAIRHITDKGLEVTISIPGGEELAQKTFNPRLGIEGGLSIIGTSGRVRPFSKPALRDALKCSIDIAAANKVENLVYVPGHIGEKAARRNFNLTDEQVVEVSNEWGFMLDCLSDYKFAKLLAMGHPGKLVKLAAGDWDTHSSRSKNALGLINMTAKEIIGRELTEAVTAEGFFKELDKTQRKQLADTLAKKIQTAISKRINWSQQNLAVVLTDMQGDILGSAGDTESWR
ncbi:MAG: cobalamin biosynthesis protein CbiD [Planctomycetes bacterium]|nr:cobalamin biosynthesis protein CbiD [Planctomycetota bacterium]